LGPLDFVFQSDVIVLVRLIKVFRAYVLSHIVIVVQRGWLTESFIAVRFFFVEQSSVLYDLYIYFFLYDWRHINIGEGEGDVDKMCMICFFLLTSLVVLVLYKFLFVCLSVYLKCVHNLPSLSWPSSSYFQAVCSSRLQLIFHLIFHLPIDFFFFFSLADRFF